MKTIYVYTIFYLLGIAYNKCISQVPIIHRIENVKDTFILKSNKPAFVFVCPIDNVNTDSLFINTATKLINSDKRIKTTEIHLCLYKPTLSANKFYKLLLYPNPSIIKLEGNFQCIALNFQCSRVDSTLARENFKKKFWFNYLSENATEALIYSTWCPQNLGERLLYYNEMIKELISPKYTEKEEIEFLKSRMANLEKELTKMQENMGKLGPTDKKENNKNEEENIKKKKFNWFKE